MNKGIIYLIQPAELVGTTRYKIGCSKTNDLKRCNNGYKNGSRYLCIMECVNPLILENIIKEKFNTKFTLIAGREYFEGDELNILTEFMAIVMEYIKKKDNNNDNYDDNINEYGSDSASDNDNNLDNINIISEIFVNYKDDEEFGGNKQLIKIIITHDDHIIIKFIYDKCIEKIDVNIKLDLYMENYIGQLITNNIIVNNEIYDLNNIVFLNKLNNYKKKINVYNSEDMIQMDIEFNKKFSSIFTNINYMLFSNTIINNDIYCNTYNFSDDKCLSIHVDLINYNTNIKIFEINQIYFSGNYLRQYIPYCIDYNKYNYIIINRDYKYIGIDNVQAELDDYIGREYLFDDGCKPWCEDENDRIINLQKILKKYNEIILNKICLNTNNETAKILSHIQRL